MVFADWKTQELAYGVGGLKESIRYDASLLDYWKPKNGTGSGKYNKFPAEIRSKLEDITDILWRNTWFSLYYGGTQGEYSIVKRILAFKQYIWAYCYPLKIVHPFGFPSWKSSHPKIIGIKPYLFENFSQKKGSRKF